MPRGTETQEPNEKPQEGRDTSPKEQEFKEETQRIDDATFESEAVVESVRDVQQSEKIEGELKAAVEAVHTADLPKPVLEASAELDDKGKGSLIVEPSPELGGMGKAVEMVEKRKMAAAGAGSNLIGLITPEK